MRFLVVSHKSCWRSDSAISSFETDGGFPFQIRALSELFDETRLCVPCTTQGSRGASPLVGNNLTVVPLGELRGKGFGRKLRVPFWLLANGPVLFREVRRADAVHAPIPGDIGTLGMLLAFMMRKPLFVRHCGNWYVQTTLAERFWHWFMEQFAGGANVMLATGGSTEAPSKRNPHLRWIFSTSLTEGELRIAAPRQRPLDPSPRLIIVCRQEEKKGTGVVISSMALILKEFPDASLDVVGDGSALEDFKTMANSLGVAEHITFHGKVDHKRVAKLLRQADVFCYPTTASEGFPKVVLEALAHGLPVITTRVSVLPELIGKGCGKLIAAPSPFELAGAVTEVLSNLNEYSEMSREAIETARQYSLERWQQRIKEHLCVAWGRPLRSDA